MGNKIIKMDQNDNRIRGEFVKMLRLTLREKYQMAETAGEKALVESLANCLDGAILPGPKM